MKQNIILWAAALVITFLAGFLDSITSHYYPVSGTIGIQGKKVSYKFDRIHFGEKPFEILIRTDIEGLSGIIEYKQKGGGWKSIPLKEGEHILYGKLPAQSGAEVEYRIKLAHYNKIYLLPSGKPVSIKFFGKVSPFINVFYYLTLFSALLLSTRCGLDFFNEQERIKKLSLFAAALFSLNAFIASPLRKTYMIDAIGKKVPAVTEIFPISNLVLFLLWIAAVIVIFNIKEYRKAAAAAAFITLVLFQVLFY